MLKGFKDFIMRGNVIDLAVGVVIGAAFTGLVTAFTNSFLQPIIKMVGASPAGPGARVKLGTGNYIEWGQFLNALITFVLTAAVLYFLVVFPMNRLAERRQRGEEPPPAAPSEEIKLLTEIRDALVAAGRTTPAQQRGALDDALGRRDEPPAAR
ncbi:large conductance mechanosensitive channel protein MscL [Verrucosispora sioxanthis]|uniref:Large-conductance mechanosensitive channel n=1 Tax=Verrucosispora sioxanthis TaxID=2499994 RepID=A0A6M1L2G1_9ACTN|nr:large conductance mechanosensitive channel protein MscL [Verrucosispora sioxanthis]NEE63591.1 large conductance mechanosensitive channel protein MscL [Verrucosispora sioxanthis]NGM12701.1 large conductance mechanosensitive channel protein MscL [Verrucosispora sioxanthis]